MTLKSLIKEIKRSKNSVETEFLANQVERILNFEDLGNSKLIRSARPHWNASYEVENLANTIKQLINETIPESIKRKIDHLPSSHQLLAKRIWFHKILESNGLEDPRLAEGFHLINDTVSLLPGEEVTAVENFLFIEADTQDKITIRHVWLNRPVAEYFDKTLVLGYLKKWQQTVEDQLPKSKDVTRYIKGVHKLEKLSIKLKKFIEHHEQEKTNPFI